jgi:acylphosphatase
MKVNVHVLISGRVQGVWFRASTRQKAEQLGIKGWVRNTSDGRVEAVFEGQEELVREIVEWCYHGPPMAKVSNVEVKKQDSTEDYDSFSVK